MDRVEHRVTRIDKCLEEQRRTLKRMETILVEMSETVARIDRCQQAESGARKPGETHRDGAIYELLKR